MTAMNVGTVEQQMKEYVDTIPRNNRWKLDKQLDFENAGREDHLIEIAEEMTNWEEDLVAKLGLKQRDVNDIKRGQHRDNPRLQRRAALRKWRQTSGFHATYRELLRIFLSARDTLCAEAVCKVLRANNGAAAIPPAGNGYQSHISPPQGSDIGFSSIGSSHHIGSDLSYHSGGGATGLKELTTLVNCTPKLELALQDDRDIVHFLNSKGLISDDVHSDVIEPISVLSRRAKAGLVVEAIKSSVKRNCQNYYILTNYLYRDGRKYSDIISILNKEFQRVSSIQGNGIPHQPSHHDSMRSSSSSSTNGQKEIAFSKDFDPVKMSKWLHTKGLPEDDYAKVQKDNITGRAFLHYSEDHWKKLDISQSGIFTLMDLQEEVKTQLADSAHHPVPTEPSQQPPSTSILKEPPPQLQGGDDLGDIDGTTELTMKNHFEVKKYTDDLSQQEVEDLGSALGLYKKTFNKMSPQTIHGATIEAWLQKRDNVIKTCGTTTWRALAKGFQAVEQHGCVEKIRRDHPSQDSSARARVDIDGGTKTPDHPSQDSSARGRVETDGGTKPTETPIHTDEKEQSLREEYSPVTTPQSGTQEHDELKKFSEEVEIILHTVNDHEYNAATTYMKAPPGGQFTKAVIFPRIGSVVGMFAGKKTALIQTQQGNKAGKDVEDALETFPKAIYILGIGVCYSLCDSKHHFGDVLVSERICNYTTPRFGTENENRGTITAVHESLGHIFCMNKDVFYKKFLVSESPEECYSKVYPGLLISASMLIADKNTREKIKESVPTAIGGEMEGGELLTFIGKKEVSGIIIIKGVADFGDDQKSEGKKWQFTAAMAAFKYAHLKLSSITDLF